MPNLKYDPQNPTDLLDQPIEPGDIVAWGTTFGRSPAVCVAVIEDIVFKRQVGYKNVKCPRQVAEKYTLRLRPLKTTGDITYINRATGMEHWSLRDGDDPADFTTKTKTVQVVRNVVKLTDSSRQLAEAML